MCVVEAQCFKWAEVEGELGDLWEPKELGTVGVLKLLTV